LYNSIQVLIFYPDLITCIQYDGRTDIKHPPHTITFDPDARHRSLFKKPDAEESTLGHLSNIIGSLVKITAPNATQATGNNTASANGPLPSTPSPTVTLLAPLSPPMNTPSKLSRFLQYAHDQLGVANAPMFEHALAREGYGPDILSDVDQQALVACGLTSGDAIRLKRGAQSWWNGPDAKKSKVANIPPTPMSDEEENRDYGIHFEKRYCEGGCKSYFGSHVVPGKNRGHREFSWWYFNTVTRKTEPVPQGMVPCLDPAFMDDPDMMPEYPSTDEDGDNNQLEGSTSA
jgi:hypothetical protein